MTFPSGTVTFLFTDIEGSTKLAREEPETWEAGLKMSLDEAPDLALNTVEGIKWFEMLSRPTVSP